MRSLAIGLLFVVAALAQRDPRFRAQEIASDFGIGYAVVIADIDRDGGPDIIAINETQVVWWENPSWTRHTALDGKTERDNVALAAHDIDGDGKVDLAVGAAWRPSDTQGGGTLQWLRQPADPRGEWPVQSIGAEPTLHRIRWADTDGDGAPELIVAPLHGRGTSGPKHWEGAGVRLLALHLPGFRQEVVDSSLHILHNFWPVDFDGDGAMELLTASYEGVHLLDRTRAGEWRRYRLGEGHRDESIRGAGEIKLGRLRNGKRYIATVEPWHANQIVVYSEPADPLSMWPRRVVADELGGAHALWTADLDGDGDDELVVGWRQEGKGDFAKPGVAIFDPGDWSWRIVDSGGMATEDLVVADLDADGKPDIVAVGRATKNVKIYWQQ